MAKKIRASYGDLLSDIFDLSGELKIGVAVSGGRDSVALLHCLKTICEEKSELKVFAVNIEHGIRGDESLRDSEFVKCLCDKWNIPLLSYSVNAVEFAKENGYTLEQSARILRYEIFDKLLDEGKCDYIALAHHLDDQVETVLMRILRGTGIHGLVGMKKLSGKYIRPLLDYDRESVDEYIKDNGLEFVDDGTNEDTAYTRNFLRQELARIKERFPSMGDAVKRLTKSALEADEFIDSKIPEIDVKDDEVYIKTADCENTLIAKRLILNACKALGVMQDIEDRHYALVLELLSAESGKYLMLTHGLCVHKEGEFLVFALRCDREVNFEYPFCADRFEEIGVSVEQVEKSSVSFGDDTLYIDADKIPDGTVIRTRRDGDVIRKFGGGSKSLGDFLTDKKIPLRLRDGLRIVANGNNVLAVFGVDISADVKLDGDTKRVYALTTFAK